MKLKKDIVVLSDEIHMIERYMYILSGSMFDEEYVYGQKFIDEVEYDKLFEVNIPFVQHPKLTSTDIHEIVNIRDRLIDQLFEEYKNQLKIKRDALTKLNEQLKNIDYYKKCLKLWKTLETTTDWSKPSNESGEKYITYDKSSSGGMWGVRFEVDNNRIYDKRFENLSDAKRGREDGIQYTINELKKILKTIGITRYNEELDY